MVAHRFAALTQGKKLHELRVEDVMSREPVTIAPDARVSEALALMEQRGVKHLPVVEHGKLVGKLSERHIRDALPSVLVMNDPAVRRKALDAVRVREVSVKSPDVVSPDAPLRELIAMMRRHKAGSTPVVRGDRLVGIVTSGDLVSLLEALLAAA